MSDKFSMFDGGAGVGPVTAQVHSQRVPRHPPMNNVIFDEREHEAAGVDQTSQIDGAVQRTYNMENIDMDKLAIQAKNPFVEMLPWPTRCVSILLANALQPYEFRAPAGTRYVRFTGDGDYWVTRNGSAQVPNAGGSNADDAYVMGACYRPEGINWYIRGDADFSVVSRTPNRNVSMMCFIEE